MGIEKLNDQLSQVESYPSPEEIKEIENEIRSTIQEIFLNVDKVRGEFENLSPEQQNEVARAVLDYLETKHGQAPIKILSGSVTAGLASLALGAGVWAAPVSIGVGVSIKLIDIWMKREANTFFTKNDQQ